jgi:hypothetical protein
MPPEMLQAFDSHAFWRLKPYQRVRVMMMMQLFAAQDAWRTGCRCASLAVMLGASVRRDVVDAGHTTVRQETAHCGISAPPCPVRVNHVGLTRPMTSRLNFGAAAK